MANADEQPTNKNETTPQSDKPAEGERSSDGGKSGTSGNAQTGADKSAEAAGGSRHKTTRTPKGGAQSDVQSAIELLKSDHRSVEKLFGRYDKADESIRAELIEESCRAIIVHTMLEEEIFYPACREAFSEVDPLDEAQVEHDSAKILILDLTQGSARDPFRDAKFRVLREQIRQHVREEESPDGIFAKAAKSEFDTTDLAERLHDRKAELEATTRLPEPRPVALTGPMRGGSRTPQESEMANNQQSRDRDDRGRFTDRDDERYDDRRQSRGSSDRGRDDEGRFTSGRGERDDDDRDDGRSRAAQQRPRDDDRRFTSIRDDDDRRGGSRSRGRDDDRGHGGWFGDREGHSEASRRGWDNPDHGRSGWYGDGQGHSEASRRGWDNPDHGPSGWYGDSRGHSEASRRGWDNSDHGPSGWYGDSRGHSDASRRGWDERGRAHDDDRSGSRSYADRDDRGRSQRGRDEDDDRGRGHGGWRGDSQGHAEASRRGWENRR